MRRGLVLATVAGCGGAQPAPASDAAACQGDRVILGDDDLAAVGSCRTFTGDLTIRGAGELDLARLAGVETVAGDLTIGPTFGVTVIHLEGLRSVTGTLRIVSNGVATGTYLPALEHAGGIEIAANVAMAGVAMPSLTGVDADLVVDGNPVLENLTAGALATVGGEVRIDHNPILTLVEIPLRVARPHATLPP